jgi:hypothetical protein
MIWVKLALDPAAARPPVSAKITMVAFRWNARMGTLFRCSRMATTERPETTADKPIASSAHR